MPDGTMGTGAQAPEPFRLFARQYHALGLSIFPCGKDNGKKPLVRWKHLQQRQPTVEELEQWIESYPAANIGLVCGHISGITVIDCDDLELSPETLFSTFGETPLIVSTPSGGYHLYYRFNGEGNSPPPLAKVDKRGQGGYVIAPPSINPATGKAYEFAQGSIESIQCLAIVKPRDFEHTPPLPHAPPKSAIISGGKAVKGQRNRTLFNGLIAVVADFSDPIALYGYALDLNQKLCVEPLPKNQVQATANSVWRYRAENRLYRKHEQTLPVPYQRMKGFMHDQPRAAVLYLDLLANHFEPDKVFAIGQEGYARRAGWNKATVRAAIQALLNQSILEKVDAGGRRKGDPALYRLKSQQVPILPEPEVNLPKHFKRLENRDLAIIDKNQHEAMDAINCRI